MVPLVRAARAAAFVSASAIAVLGVVAGGVRVLPWLLDPDVPWRVAAPFARGLAAVAFETALVVGWPVGWAIACFRAVESGEARVLQTLGESPAASVARLAGDGLVLALSLGIVAFAAGRDANAPGRMATELLVEARASCAAARAPVSYVVPFTEMAWLCAPGRAPRLAGPVPGVPQGAVMTARGARISGDFRALELDDARLALGGGDPSLHPAIAVQVATLSVRGMAPWAHASTLGPGPRAVLIGLSAWCAAFTGAFAVMQRAAGSRAGAIALGAVGPLVALGLLRILERADARPAAFVLVPMATWAAAASVGALLPHIRLRLARSSRGAGWRFSGSAPLP